MAVVPAKECAYSYVPQGYRCGSFSGFGMARKHESYLIAVPGKGKALYWPRVMHLEEQEVKEVTWKRQT